ALQSTLLVTTVRSEDVDEQLLGVLRGLERQRLLERIALGPLAVEATVQLLREVVQEDVRHLGQQLHDETEGNPLFAVETIRSLLESGALRLGAAARPGPTPLPESVQAAIRARLARLDPDAYELTRAAAVLGGDVDFDHVRGVAGQDEDRALAALERLLSTHLLREVTGDVGEALYSFSHDKVRQVVYDDLSAARRRVQHRRALDVMAQPSTGAPAVRLAYHAIRAHAWDQAMRWCDDAVASEDPTDGPVDDRRRPARSVLAHLRTTAGVAGGVRRGRARAARSHRAAERSARHRADGDHRDARGNLRVHGRVRARARARRDRACAQRSHSGPGGP